MKFNQDKFLQDAFRLFMSMNYEKASFTKLAEVTGMTGAGISYYYPNKEAIFKAVVDKFVLQTHSPENKFKLTATTLKEFIIQYVEGIEETMKKLRVFSAEMGEYFPIYDLELKKEGMKVKEEESEGWSALAFSEIEGFEYEKGYEYVLKVKKTTLANPPMDGNEVRYKLIKIVSKDKSAQ